ncbi:cation:proton antiporter [Myxococcota bacterium]|nr:cation:proton antiporter [Myxococcota bacterium]
MSKPELLLLVFMVIGAFIIPFLTRFIQMPNAAGEIVYGLVLARIFPGYLSHNLEFLGELGFILLMYLAGLEIDFERLRKTKAQELWVYIFLFLSIGIFGFFSSWILNLPPLFGVVFLTTAVGLLFPVLKDSGLLHRSSGQRLLLIGTIGEIMSLIVLTIFILYHKYGFSSSSIIHLAEILLFGLLVVFVLKLYRHVTWWFPQLSKLFMTSENTFESSVRGNLVHMFIFVGVAALLNLELIIGAFIGGMIFAAIFSAKEDVLHKMGSFGYGFLVPLFFITVGMKFNITDFFHIKVVWLALIITSLILIIRLISSPLLLIVGFSTREILATSVALTFPLTLLVAIATFGLDSGSLNKSQTAGILLASILTSVIYPVIFKKLAGKQV